MKLIMGNFPYIDHFKEKLSCPRRFLREVSFWVAGSALAAAFLLASLIIGFEAAFAGKIYPGVSVGKVMVGGKTTEEVTVILEKEFGVKPPEQLLVTHEERIWLVDLEKLDLKFDKETTVKEAFAVGRKGDFSRRWGRTLEAVTTGVRLSPFYLWNGDYLGELLTSLEKEINKEPVEAKFRFEPTRKKVMEFRVSENGKRLLSPEFITALEKLLKEAREGEKKLTMKLPVATVKPKITTSEANNLGIEKLLGRGESFFYGSSPSRMFNIRLAAERVSGTLIAPGEIFSFNGSLGEVSSFTGFKKELVIKKGELILEDGGGVCQVSTTLFRAVLNSGLPIEERREHSYRVGYYEQGGYLPGFDATVYPGIVDFRFKNDTEGYILLQVNFDERRRKLTFELYGKDEGRVVFVGKPVVVSTTAAPEPIYKDDSTLLAGTEKILEKSIPGTKVYFTYKVEKGGETIIEEQIWSHFRPKTAVIARGTKP